MLRKLRACSDGIAPRNCHGVGAAGGGVVAARRRGVVRGRRVGVRRSEAVHAILGAPAAHGHDHGGDSIIHNF